MADELYSRDDLLGRYIRWALLYTRNRYELAEELDQLHGKVAQTSRIVLMTPAIVDFSKWLEDDDQLTIQSQVEVMARIACRKDGPRVHGFVGFDPLRQALYDHNRGSAADGDPMAVVRRAIEVNHIGLSNSTKVTGGFIGVKLYPPMGFRATDNKHLPDANFNEPAYLRSPDTGLGSHIGSKLDAALAKLYSWCSANNVPIMAHTSHSFGPNTDYEDRADPIFWAAVLKQDAFSRLRALTWLISAISTTPCNTPVHKITSTNVGNGRSERFSPVRPRPTRTSARLARSSRRVPVGKSSNA